MIDYQKELNSEQLAVVQNGDGPCLVLAGAGSGKTRAITYRVAYLLEHGVKPNEILLVTFTNKAAREMMTRVDLLMRGEAHLAWAGTFHHIGYRLLCQYAPLLGYKNNFSILDSEDSVNLLKLCFKQEGIDRKERRFPSPKVLHAIISYARNAETTIEDVLDEQHPKWLDIAETLTRIASDYEKRKREANAMDFDDLLVNTHLLLLKSERVRQKYSEQFRYILVDEYQDTNKIQASIIRLFASHHKNILVVGDDAQSIYSFRAADIQNILDFSAQGGSAFGGEGYPDAKIFKLETNYRSTPDILQVANEVIANNANQYQKELKSVVSNFAKPEVHAFADNQEEAAFIADRILELRDEGLELDDMAVLFRAAFHSQALEVELTKRDIPYEYRGGIRFFERAHIKDVLAYLRIFNNLEDIVAWSRVLNMQVGIGPAVAEMIMKTFQPKADPPLAEKHENMKTLSVVDKEKSEYNLPHVDLGNISISLSARAQVGWNDFLQIWGQMTENTPAELIRAVIDSKYRDYLENEYPDYRERLQDLEQLAIFAERQPDLNKFLADASLHESYAAGQVKEAEAGDAHSTSSWHDEKLVLSTIHQAKGLEWSAVFILNVSAGQFPSERALREAKGLEEERRLFYVAVTRAKKHLYFTYPLIGSFDSMLNGPSPFLKEIGRESAERHEMQGETVIDDVTYEAIDKPIKSFLKDVGEL